MSVLHPNLAPLRSTLLCVSLSTLCSSKVHASDDPIDLKTYPAPSGLAASPNYRVMVCNGTEWAESFVNFDPARLTGSGAGEHRERSFSWTTFEIAQATRVRVQRLSGGFESVVIRPKRLGITAEKIGGDTVEFTIEPKRKVSVEFDSEINPSAFDGTDGIPCVENIMMIFADKRKLDSAIDGIREAEILRVAPGEHEALLPVQGADSLAGKCTLGNAGGRSVVVFGPGVYDIGYWQVPNNIDHIHIEGGAIVYGAIDVLPQGRTPFDDLETAYQIYRHGWKRERLRDSFKITGSGVLSAAKLPWHLRKDFSYTHRDDWSVHVKAVQLAVENVLLEDVTLVNSPHWVLTFLNDVDDRTHGVFRNFKIVGGWTYNNDGLPLATGPGSLIQDAFIHANDDAIKIYNSGSRVEDCVIWQGSNGAAFQFGWFPKDCSDVSVSNIDVIHFENWYGVQQANRAVFNYANTRGRGEIRDIDFTNIHVENKVLRLFGFHCGNQKIRNLTFTNLSCDGMGVGRLGPPGANYLIGQISDWTFNNFFFAGHPVVDSSQALFEFGDGAGKGFVFHVDGATGDR